MLNQNERPFMTYILDASSDHNLFIAKFKNKKENGFRNLVPSLSRSSSSVLYKFDTDSLVSAVSSPIAGSLFGLGDQENYFFVENLKRSEDQLTKPVLPQLRTRCVSICIDRNSKATMSNNVPHSSNASNNGAHHGQNGKSIPPHCCVESQAVQQQLKELNIPPYDETPNSGTVGEMLDTFVNGISHTAVYLFGSDSPQDEDAKTSKCRRDEQCEIKEPHCIPWDQDLAEGATHELPSLFKVGDKFPSPPEPNSMKLSPGTSSPTTKSAPSVPAKADAQTDSLSSPVESKRFFEFVPEFSREGSVAHSAEETDNYYGYSESEDVPSLPGFFIDDDKKISPKNRTLPDSVFMYKKKYGQTKEDRDSTNQNSKIESLPESFLSDQKRVFFDTDSCQMEPPAGYASDEEKNCLLLRLDEASKRFSDPVPPRNKLLSDEEKKVLLDIERRFTTPCDKHKSSHTPNAHNPGMLCKDSKLDGESRDRSKLPLRPHATENAKTSPDRTPISSRKSSVVSRDGNHASNGVTALDFPSVPPPPPNSPKILSRDQSATSSQRESSVAGTRPSSLVGTGYSSVAGTRPSSLVGTRPPSDAESQLFSDTGTRPPSIAESRPSYIAGTRPPSVAENRPLSVAGTRPASVTESQPSSVAETWPSPVDAYHEIMKGLMGSTMDVFRTSDFSTEVIRNTDDKEEVNENERSPRSSRRSSLGSQSSASRRPSVDRRVPIVSLPGDVDDEIHHTPNVETSLYGTQTNVVNDKKLTNQSPPVSRNFQCLRDEIAEAESKHNSPPMLPGRDSPKAAPFKTVKQTEDPESHYSDRQSALSDFQKLFSGIKTNYFTHPSEADGPKSLSLESLKRREEVPRDYHDVVPRKSYEYHSGELPREDRIMNIKNGSSTPSPKSESPPKAQLPPQRLDAIGRSSEPSKRVTFPINVHLGRESAPPMLRPQEPKEEENYFLPTPNVSDVHPDMIQNDKTMYQKYTPVNNNKINQPTNPMRSLSLSKSHPNSNSSEESQRPGRRTLPGPSHYSLEEEEKHYDEPETKRRESKKQPTETIADLTPASNSPKRSSENKSRQEEIVSRARRASGSPTKLNKNEVKSFPTKEAPEVNRQSMRNEESLSTRSPTKPFQNENRLDKLVSQFRRASDSLTKPFRNENKPDKMVSQFRRASDSPTKSFQNEIKSFLPSKGTPEVNHQSMQGEENRSSYGSIKPFESKNTPEEMVSQVRHASDSPTKPYENEVKLFPAKDAPEVNRHSISNKENLPTYSPTKPFENENRPEKMVSQVRDASDNPTKLYQDEIKSFLPARDDPEVNRHSMRNKESRFSYNPTKSFQNENRPDEIVSQVRRASDSPTKPYKNKVESFPPQDTPEVNRHLMRNEENPPTYSPAKPFENTYRPEEIVSQARHGSNSPTKLYENEIKSFSPKDAPEVNRHSLQNKENQFSYSSAKPFQNENRPGETMLQIRRTSDSPTEPFQNEIKSFLPAKDANEVNRHSMQDEENRSSHSPTKSFQIKNRPDKMVSQFSRANDSPANQYQNEIKSFLPAKINRYSMRDEDNFLSALEDPGKRGFSMYKRRPTRSSQESSNNPRPSETPFQPTRPIHERIERESSQPYSSRPYQSSDRSSYMRGSYRPLLNVDRMSTPGARGRRTTFNGPERVSELSDNGRTSVLPRHTRMTIDPRAASRLTRTSPTPMVNPPHPAGIILDRSEYYTVPSMEELADLTDSNGSCIVSDFTIGRIGYGTIRFEGEVNLTGMNLDEIVQIRRKEVALYPDDAFKPPVGSGLNRRAEVSLDNSWPIDIDTRDPITDPFEIIDIGWVEDLELITEKMGAHFLEFKHDSGSWVFLVEHFSEYSIVGLLDSQLKYSRKNRESQKKENFDQQTSSRATSQQVLLDCWKKIVG